MKALRLLLVIFLCLNIPAVAQWAPFQASIISVAKNIVTDYGAVCNGVDSDATAFGNFNTFAQTQTILVVLTIPAGKTCAPCNNFLFGTHNVRVVMYGATITDLGGPCQFQLGTNPGQPQDDTKIARIQTTAVSDSSVTLITAGEASRFSVNTWVLITSGDLIGFGYATAPYNFEYNYITAINGGVISLLNPVKNIYNKDYPRYDLDVGHLWQGGPALIYELNSPWDANLSWWGGTFNFVFDAFAAGRTMTFKDNTWSGAGCTPPTQAQTWYYTNVTTTDACVVEVDKLVENVVVTGGSIFQLKFQSGNAITNTTISGATISLINGTPQNISITNSAVSTLRIGALSYGATNAVNCTNSTISAVDWRSNGAVVDVLTNYTISNGTIIIPRTSTDITGPPTWATPGGNVMFQGQYSSEQIFQVGAITGDATNIYVATSLGSINTFPALPTTGGVLKIGTHPGPKITFNNCHGSPEADDLSLAPAQGKPLWSYTSRTYTQTLNGAGPFIEMWGNITDAKFNVTTAFAGIEFRPMAQDHITLIKSDGSTYSYTPIINAATAGLREVTPTSVTGTQTGDSGLAIQNPSWMPESTQAFQGTNITGSGPLSVTVTIQTDQGVVSP